MCTVEQVVYVRQQTVQHTPVKLKTLIFNSNHLCEYICGSGVVKGNRQHVNGKFQMDADLGTMFGRECVHYMS